MADVVRVLRVIEYVGTREDVERTVAQSVQGERVFQQRSGNFLTIKAATIGVYPEILIDLPLDEREVVEYSKGDA